jgi:hypothetical protein
MERGIVFATNLYLLRIKHRRRFPMNIKIISAILVLALASMACGFSVDLPPRAETGPDVEETITVADPESDETRLSLNFGAGELKLSSGAEGLVEGTALYNVEQLKPEVVENDGNVEIKQGDLDGVFPFDNLKTGGIFSLAIHPWI